MKQIDIEMIDFIKGCVRIAIDSGDDIKQFYNIDEHEIEGQLRGEAKNTNDYYNSLPEVQEFIKANKYEPLTDQDIENMPLEKLKERFSDEYERVLKELTSEFAVNYIVTNEMHKLQNNTIEIDQEA